jgi:hypothetical protein
MIAGVLALLGLCVAVAILARRDEEATERLWAQLLSPMGRRACEALGLRLTAQERAIEFTRQQAREAAKAGEAEKAARLVEAGRLYETQTRLERHRLALLRRMQSALRRRSG